MIFLDSNMAKQGFGLKTRQDIDRRMSDVNWNHVFAFSQVASHGSLKNAANVMNVGSSTLSEQISQLESTLNAELFHRRGPKLILTEAGNRLFWHTKKMFESGQRILDSVSPLVLGSYPAAVGVVPGPHIQIAHKTICDYAAEYGPVDLKIRQSSFEEMEAGLVQAKLDFGFSDRPPQRKDLAHHRLSSSEIRFFVSEKWQDQKLVEVLSLIPLLVCRSEASTDAFIENALEKCGISPCAVVRAEYPSVLLDMCMSGLGVGAFSAEATSLFFSDSIHRLRVPRGAPVIESKAFLIWAKEGEKTEAVDRIRRLLNI